MDSQVRGFKATPPALFLGLALPIVHAIVQLVDVLTRHGRFPMASLIMIGEGVGFTCAVLAIAGTLELYRRFRGGAATAVGLAVAGVVVAFAADVVSGLGQFAAHWYEHTWIFRVYDYGGAIGWVIFAIGMTAALPARARAAGVVVIVFTFLTWPVEPLRAPLYGWLHLGETSTYVFDAVLRVLRYASLIGVVLLVCDGVTTSTPETAAGGLRLAAKAMWLRIIAAVSVSLLTLLLMAGRGSGGFELLRTALMAQGFIGVVALAMFGGGILRAAAASVPGLGRYTLVIGGGASVFAAGVSLAQLPHLYHMLYGNDSLTADVHREMAQTLAIALPLVVTVGVAMIATALAGFAARRGDGTLQTYAHSSGVGFVLSMLVAIAIQAWMVPTAESLSSGAMMMLAAAGAGLWATVMMANLLTRGAEALESEPSLPVASVVSGPS